MTDDNLEKLSIWLKIASVYLIVAGLFGLLWPLLGLGLTHPEFEALSTASKAGTYFRGSLLDLVFVGCGIGLLLRQPWARTWSLIVLVVTTIYSGNDFAWGFANGPPSTEVRLLSYAGVTAWNAIWFFLVLRNARSR